MENTNAPFGPTVTPAPQQQHGSGRGKIVVAIITILVVALGAAAYYFWPAIKAKFFSEQPPSISFTSPKFQGMLRPEQLAGNPACQLPGITYTADDVATFAPIASGFDSSGFVKSPVTAGIHLYKGDKDWTIMALKGLIVPKEDNVVTIAYYSYGKGDKAGLAEDFYSHPQITDNLATDDFVIPANQGFVIISCLDTEIYSVTDETKDGRAIPFTLTENNIEDSWILTSHYDGFFTDLNNSPYEIKSVWQQKNADLDSVEFEQLTGETLLDNGYKMLWVKTGATKPVLAAPLEVRPTPAEGPVSRPINNDEPGEIAKFYLEDYDVAAKSASLYWTHVTDLYNIYIIDTAGEEISVIKVELCTTTSTTLCIKRFLVESSTIDGAVIHNLEPGVYNFMIKPVYGPYNAEAAGKNEVFTVSGTPATATGTTPSATKSDLEDRLSPLNVESNEDTLALVNYLLNPKPALTSFSVGFDNTDNTVVLSWYKPKDDTDHIIDINNYEIYYKPESEDSSIRLTTTTSGTAPYLATATGTDGNKINVKVNGLDNGIYQFSIIYHYKDGSKTSPAEDTLEVDIAEDATTDTATEGDSTNLFEGATRIEPGSTRPPRPSGDTGGIAR